MYSPRSELTCYDLPRLCFLLDGLSWSEILTRTLRLLCPSNLRTSGMISPGRKIFTNSTALLSRFSLTPEQFSRRHGFGGAAAEIRVRDDAPPNVRDAVLIIAEGELNLSPHTIREWLCTVLRRLPDQSNWTAY